MHESLLARLNIESMPWGVCVILKSLYDDPLAMGFYYLDQFVTDCADWIDNVVPRLDQVSDLNTDFQMYYQGEHYMKDVFIYMTKQEDISMRTVHPFTKSSNEGSLR